MSLSGWNAPSLRFDNCRANFADGFPLGGNFRQLHQQTIGKLIAGFAGVDVRRDHLGRACFVKRLNKFQGIILAFESSERAHGLAAAFQPLPRFGAILLRQKGTDKNFMDVLFRGDRFRQRLAGLRRSAWAAICLLRGRRDIPRR